MKRNTIRRRDRAINDYQQMLAVMRQCDVCRLGFADEEGVYIVPLNFGMRAGDDNLTLYFHGVLKGKKMALARQRPLVGFEMDRKHELVEADTACDHTYLFQSIIGKGRLSVVEDEAEKNDALQELMFHQTGKRGWTFNETDFRHVGVLKLDVTEWSCKEH